MTDLAIVEPGEVDTWEQRGRQIAEKASNTMWEIGDWVNDADDAWGERYKRASDITGFAVGTLRNAAYVSARFDLSLRNDKLGFQHHLLVAAIPEEAATQWLELAADGDWSVRELQAALRSVKQLPPGQPEVVVTVFKVTVPHHHEERWRRAADTRGLEVEKWLVEVAEEAATVALSEA